MKIGVLIQHQKKRLTLQYCPRPGKERQDSL
jgi:hypothetical protein